MINRPQLGPRLKYFMRLVAIGTDYRKAKVRIENEEGRSRYRIPENGKGKN
jgi:hypothetical protein